MVVGWNPFFFLKHRFHILHFPNSTGLFTKPTSHNYTKYRFFPDIDVSMLSNLATASQNLWGVLTSSCSPASMNYAQVRIQAI